MGSFSEKVFAIVNQIPRGKVASYGQVARLMGSPRSSRYVGFALRANPEPASTPCHRVVFKDGRICEGYAFGGPEIQRQLLKDEGVDFVDDRHINMKVHEWIPEIELSCRPDDVDWNKEIGD